MSSIDYSFLSSFQKEILVEAENKKSGALAIPMGSGKTIISLVLARLFRENTEKKTPALIVVSKSLVNEWVEQIDKFFGESVPYHVMHPDGYCSDILKCDVNRFHIVITTPEIVMKHYKQYNMESICVNQIHGNGNTIYYTRPDKPLGNTIRGPNPLYCTNWSSYTIDEGNNFLNHRTQRTRSMIFISSEHRWILSGTLFSEPKKDNVFGYMLLLNDSKTPRNRPDFAKRFKEDNYEGVKRTVVKRETNEDYIPEDLGQIINKTVVTHSFFPEEADFFLRVKSIINILCSRLDDIKKIKDAALKAESKLLRGMALGMVTYIRQSLVCSLIPISSMMMKMSNLETRDKTVLSFVKEMVDLNKEWLDNEESVYSSRLRKVVELIDNHPTERIVIFSQFRTVLNILKYYLPKERLSFTIDSVHTISQRQEIISQWEENKGSILLLTYTLGSCGLNLQKGNIAIIVDYGWDVDVTKQAIARIVRRGQKHKKMFLYYLTSNTGVENAIYKMHQTKTIMSQELQEGVIKQKKDTLKLKDIIKLINMEDNYSILSTFYTK